MVPFFKLSTKNYEPISHEDIYLYNQYEFINSFIKRNFNSRFHNLLAKPNLKSNEVNWFTNQEGIFRRISEINQQEKIRFLKMYWDFKNQIDVKIDELKQAKNKDKKNWAIILENVFNEDYNIIFTNKTDIIILWGWKFSNKGENFFPIEQPKKSIEQTETNTAEETQINDQSEKIKPVVKEVKQNLEIKKKTTWWKKLLNKLWFFLKKYWWLILAIVILFLLASQIKSCNSSTNDYELNPNGNNNIIEDGFVYSENFDNNSGYIIIDGKKIIEGEIPPIGPPENIIYDYEENDYEEIISDRINIALKPNNDHSIFDFIKKLNEVYPHFEILFYREESKLTQIKIPKDQRVFLKKEIKSKFKALGYNLLVWDEVIFRTIVYDSYNDPVFNSSVKRWHFDAIGVGKAWDITKGSKEITIAIIDDGFDLMHEDLRKNIVKPWNVKKQNDNIFSIGDTSHGTHVAGLAIASQNNFKGTSGIAPNCSFMPIQIGSDHNGFSSLSIIEGVLYAINSSADVINLSIAKYFPIEVLRLPYEDQIKLKNSISLDEALFWNELFEMADKKNISIVLAAGNQNILVGIDAMSRSNYSINVAAIDLKKNKSDFSNYSYFDTDISAPGGSSMGKGIYSCFAYNNYGFISGTSMSAPIVSGAIGLIKSINPNISNKEIKKLLRITGEKIDTLIGPLLQIDKALLYLKNNPSISELSADNQTQKRINELRKEINTLLDECPECN